MMDLQSVGLMRYTNVNGHSFDGVFFTFCTVEGVANEDGDCAMVAYVLTGEVLPRVRIVARERVSFIPPF